MSREHRTQLIEEIEEKLASKVCCYITGRRPGLFSTQIASDVIPLFKEELDAVRFSPRLDLFLYSFGGIGIAPLRLVKLFREYCEVFGVIVPYRAYSAATLICLGADEILMGKLAELTPVDATTTHPFNPSDPMKPQQKLPISVEDVTSYFMLARERAHVGDDQMAQIYTDLANKIHPLALGNVYRNYRMSRLLCEKLLGLHLDVNKEKDKIDHIIHSLTEALPIHEYPITRDEAEKEVGLNVKRPDETLELSISTLYGDYVTDLQLDVPFNPLDVLAEKESATFQFYGAYIESKLALHGFEYQAAVKRDPKNPRGAEVNVRILGWKRIA